MKRTLPFLLLLATLFAFAQGFPGKTPGGQLTIYGCSDEIVLATISTVVSTDPSTTINGVNLPIISTLSMTVDQTLKGDAKVGDKITVNVTRNPSYGRDATGAAVLKGYTPDVEAKQQSIFFLQKAAGGYAIVMGASGILDGTSVTDVQDALKSLVVSATCEMPKTPLYFGQASEVKVTIKNDGQDPLDVVGVYTDAFYYSTRMDPISISTKGEGTGATATTLPSSRSPLAVAAGASVSLTMDLAVAAPQAWQMFGPDSYLETPASVRLKLNLQYKPATGSAQFYSIATPWSNVIVGYQPPDAFTPKATTPPITPPPTP